MRAFYSDHFVLPLPAGHKSPMAKYSGLRARILAERIIAPDDLDEAPAASLDDLRLTAIVTIHTNTIHAASKEKWLNTFAS